MLAILLSSWAAARVTRPVERLAHAAQEVAAGNWDVYVDVSGSDELGQLADSFNRMTTELLAQKERLVQAERVAAWRELARRLAHELKNPLFPLQLTMENLVRARQQSPEQFEEVFRESSRTLLAEIANLKGIIGRFSEFSKMPQPQLRPVQVNDVVRGVMQLFQAQLEAPGRAKIKCDMQLDPHYKNGSGGYGIVASGNFEPRAQRRGRDAARRQVDSAHTAGSRQSTDRSCGYGARDDGRRAGANIYSLLYEQGARHRPGAGDCAICCERSRRQSLGTG